MWEPNTYWPALFIVACKSYESYHQFSTLDQSPSIYLMLPSAIIPSQCLICCNGWNQVWKKDEACESKALPFLGHKKVKWETAPAIFFGEKQCEEGEILLQALLSYKAML